MGIRICEKLVVNYLRFDLVFKLVKVYIIKIERNYFFSSECD